MGIFQNEVYFNIVHNISSIKKPRLIFIGEKKQMWQHTADRMPRLEKLNETMNTKSFENPSQLNC